ncbi:MAG: hypothetical protein QW828_03810 [Candidatus Bathyarchaeia archaeon]
MTEEELTQAYKKAREAYEKFGLRAVSPNDLKALFLYEIWEDGADWWSTVKVLMRDPIYSEQDMRRYLVDVFGYNEG